MKGQFGESSGMDKEHGQLRRGMGLFDLVLFNVVAIMGLRWAAVAAGAGPSSIVLWILACFLFFIPSALVVTELSSRCPGEGGVYLWAKEAFGEFHGFMCGFFYWVNNLIYYPNLLIFLSGVFLYSLGTRFLPLGESTLYSTVFSLVILWIAIGANMMGVQKGKWIQNLGSFGTWLPGLALIIMGAIAWVKFGSANTFQGNLVPDFGRFDTWSVFSTLCFGFAGMELLSCMGEEIESPLKNIPRAIFISGIVIAVTYILSTAALLVSLPSKELNLISGVVQVISTVSQKVNLPFLGPAIALLMTLGGLGGCGAWMSGTARVPFVIGIDNYLPPWMAEIHPKWGTPANAILAQGVVSSLFILMGAIGAGVKETYLLLIDATLILYFIPYVYIFAAYIAWKKMKRAGDEEIGRAFNFPSFLGVLGIIVTIFAIVLALVPPGDVKNPWLYEGKVVGGVIFFFLIGWRMYKSARRKMKFGAMEGKDAGKKNSKSE